MITVWGACTPPPPKSIPGVGCWALTMSSLCMFGLNSKVIALVWSYLIFFLFGNKLMKYQLNTPLVFSLGITQSNN